MSSTECFNIGGKLFEVETETLARIPGSLLSELDKTHPKYNPTKNWYYFDRDPASFRHIVNACRDRELHVTRDVCPRQFRKELEYWRIPVSLLAPCCWKYFYETKEDMASLSSIVNRTNQHNSSSKIAAMPSEGRLDSDLGDVKPESKKPSNLWLFLEEPNSSKGAKVRQITTAFYLPFQI